MTIKEKCSCCGNKVKSKESKNIGRNELGLWLNCKCGTTLLLPNKKTFKELKETKV